MQRLINELNQQQKEHVFPGYVLSLLEEGKFSKTAYGYQQVIPTLKKVDINNYYDLASLTKSLTAVIILQILEEKGIAVTEKVKAYLPGFKDQTVEIKHLLNHTAGLIGFIPRRNELSKEELKDALLKLSPQHPVGKEVHYSDHHYLILGMLEEVLTKKSLQENLDKYLNLPLKTEFTYFPKEENCVPTSPLYEKEGKWVMNLTGIPHDPKARIFQREAGHAGVFARLEDLEKFLLSLLEDNFLSETIKKQIFTDSTIGLKRSLGFKLLEKPQGGLVISHTGYTGTLIILDKITKKSLIFLSNRVHPIDMRAAYILKRDEFIKIYLSEV